MVLGMETVLLGTRWGRRRWVQNILQCHPLVHNAFPAIIIHIWTFIISTRRGTYAVEFPAELGSVHDRKSVTQTVRFAQNFVVFRQLACNKKKKHSRNCKYTGWCIKSWILVVNIISGDHSNGQTSATYGSMAPATKHKGNWLNCPMKDNIQRHTDKSFNIKTQKKTNSRPIGFCH